MTLHATNLLYEFVGVDEMISNTDITEEEVEDAFKDDYEDVIGAFGLFEILEIVLDERDGDYVYFRVTDYEPHFKIYEVSIDE